MMTSSDDIPGENFMKYNLQANLRHEVPLPDNNEFEFDEAIINTILGAVLLVIIILIVI